MYVYMYPKEMHTSVHQKTVQNFHSSSLKQHKRGNVYAWHQQNDQIMMYSYNEILQSNKNEKSVTICNEMDQSHNVKRERHKRVWSIGVHLRKVQKHVKQILAIRKGIMVTMVTGRCSNFKGAWDNCPGVQVIYFLIGVLVTQVCFFCENSPKCTLTCTLLFPRRKLLLLSDSCLTMYLKAF